MEKEVLSRTGRIFGDLHDLVCKTELGSQRVEDFIKNDSKLLKIVNSVDVHVQAIADDTSQPHSPSNHDTELDLSSDRCPSCLDYIKKCARAKYATFAVLAEGTFDDSARAESWPFGVLDLLCWFCPNIFHVDVTSSQINNISIHPIRDFLNPSFLINCEDAAKSIRKWLDEKPILPFTNREGWSLLHSAILLGDIQLGKELLANNDNGCKESIKSSILQTSLELAISLHHCEIVELLKNKPTNSIDPTKLVQLCFLRTCDDKVYELPLKDITSKADILQATRNWHNSQSCDLNALLQIFCKDSDIDFSLKVLEEIFHRVHTSTKSDGDPVFLCWNEMIICEAVEMLMKLTGSSPNEKIAGFPYLMFSMPNIALALFLIREGAYVDERDNSGCTALFHAVQKAITSPSVENKSFVEFLVTIKANLNFRNNHGETPLIYSLTSLSRPCELCRGSASSDGKTPPEADLLETWLLLLTNGAKTKIKDDNDRSPVHLLVNLSDKLSTIVCEGIKVLHTNGCAINARDADGNTPLHLWAGLSPREASSDDNFEEIGRTIISCGGAINARNDHEETPLHLAQCWKQVKFLLEQGAHPNVQDLSGGSPLHRFMGKDSLIGEKTKKGLWKKFLTWGMNPWRVNNSGICPFEILLGKGFLQSSLLLLKAVWELDINEVVKSARCFKDPHGNSLLHNVCTINSSKVKSICEYLLTKGWNVNDQNNSGQTPLFLLCSQVGHMELSDIQDGILLLRKYHADPSIPDVDGNTCQALLHESKRLQELLQQNIDKVEIPCKIKWKRQSKNHKIPLFDVAHGKNSQIVEGFHHHVNHIGNGSFSVVFPGVNEKDGREVALKRLEKARLKETDTQLKREIACLVKLSNCPNVVNYVTCVSDSNFQYIVMELMEGTLDAYLDLEQANNDTAKICLDISSGIKYLHDNNVLHRDLKPQNILYKTKPNLIVKIADFGLSKILDEAKSGHSSNGTVTHSRAGTRCWKAPELLQKKLNEHSKRSDIFSCGLLFHYILANKKHPFGHSESTEPLDPQTTEENIRTNRFDFCTSLTHEAAHLLAKMLSAQPEQRPKASSLKCFPFFWNDHQKRHFLIAIGNQKVIEEPRPIRHRPLTDVEKHLEDVYSKKWKNVLGWDSYISDIFYDVTKQYNARQYTARQKKSAVELARFIRNSYNHVNDFSEKTQQLILKKSVFFKRFPCLVTEVYKAVEACDEWKTKEDLIQFFQ